jgi:hypothetical protein
VTAKKILLAAIAALSLANFSNSFAMQRFVRYSEDYKIINPRRTLMNALKNTNFFWHLKANIFYISLCNQENLKKHFESMALRYLPFLVTSYKKAIEENKIDFANTVKTAFKIKFKPLLKQAILTVQQEETNYDLFFKIEQKMSETMNHKLITNLNRWLSHEKKRFTRNLFNRAYDAGYLSQWLDKIESDHRNLMRLTTRSLLSSFINKTVRFQDTYDLLIFTQYIVKAVAVELIEKHIISDFFDESLCSLEKQLDLAYRQMISR